MHGAILLLLLHSDGSYVPGGEDIDCLIDFPMACVCQVATVSSFAGDSPAGIGVLSNKTARSEASQTGIGVAGSKTGRSGRV